MTLARGISFIEMCASLHHHHFLPGECAQHQLAGVAWNGGIAKVGDLSVGDGNSILHLLGKHTQPGAKDEADAGCLRRPPRNGVDRLLQLAFGGEDIVRHELSAFR
jgi:hypothetical protein